MPLNLDLVLWNRKPRIDLLPLSANSNSAMAPYSDNYSQFEDSYYESMKGVEVCELCGDYAHSTNACSYNSDPLTPRQDEQSLEDMFKEYSSVTQSCDKKETLNDVTLTSVEANELAMNEYFGIDGLTPCMCEYWSDHEELEGKHEVSQSEPEIVMAQTHEEEAKKEIEVTLTRPEVLERLPELLSVVEEGRGWALMAHQSPNIPGVSLYVVLLLPESVVVGGATVNGDLGDQAKFILVSRDSSSGPQQQRWCLYMSFLFRVVVIANSCMSSFYPVE
ncbi:hypothetical protein Sjap_013121 [Stephania japonica]|uniref:Uncharacterized protein n=1 Tax=Stephania japonica TaxID=461633 RepID=A0AAP0NYV9_9MAGN